MDVIVDFKHRNKYISQLHNHICTKTTNITNSAHISSKHVITSSKVVFSFFVNCFNLSSQIISESSFCNLFFLMYDKMAVITSGLCRDDFPSQISVKTGDKLFRLKNFAELLTGQYDSSLLLTNLFKGLHGVVGRDLEPSMDCEPTIRVNIINKINFRNQKCNI